MYIPSHFIESRPEILHDLMTNNPFAVLITHGEAGLDANHLPFLLNVAAGNLGVLEAHVARANPLWQQLTSGDEVLIVFKAEDGYISPSWYPSKHALHQQVPTWNYRVVHVRGKIVIRDDDRFVRGVVARLTRKHEAGETTPWKMGDSAPEYIDTVLKAIVGIEIHITHLEGKFKLSQNKAVTDIYSAGMTLKARGKEELGTAMVTASHQKADGTSGREQ
jgi:transcriptional regulator